MSEAAERKFAAEIARYAHDPLGFVRVAFPWGKPGDLMTRHGPDVWQVRLLQAISEKLLTPEEAIQLAVASGHGVGKSAIVSWIILWAMSTMTDCRGVVTANTESQLRTKTWPELAKWHRMLICRDWFVFTSTAIYSVDANHEKTWRVDMIPWSETNTEAFAGLHNQGRRILVIFDEASAIADRIWETTEGALTDADTEILWCVFGNPTRNTGRFRECFGRYRHRWVGQQVDSRTVAITNKGQIDRWVADYGEDSDFVRVRVRGVFPRAGSMQLIPADIVEACQQYASVATTADPLIMGVDVARFGDDQTVIVRRKGRDAGMFPAIKYRGADTMQVAARVADLHRETRCDAIFVDETGVGAGVVDRLRQLQVPVIGVNFAGKADRADPTGSMPKCANKRAEMWVTMLQAMKEGLRLPDDADLVADLCGLEYGFNLQNEILLEKKADMKKRGLASPDFGDALALTYAYPVMPRGLMALTGAGHAKDVGDYDPFSAL